MDEESAVPVITEIIDREDYSVIPTWVYIAIFTIPAIFTYCYAIPSGTRCATFNRNFACCNERFD